VVRYGNRFLQVHREGNHQAPAKGKVAVCEWQDGRVEIRYRGQKVLWTEIAESMKPNARTTVSNIMPTKAKNAAVLRDMVGLYVHCRCRDQDEAQSEPATPRLPASGLIPPPLWVQQ
jgi:hypothetical protein